jgi:hypothetical protein
MLAHMRTGKAQGLARPQRTAVVVVLSVATQKGLKCAGGVKGHSLLRAAFLDPENIVSCATEDMGRLMLTP